MKKALSILLVALLVFSTFSILTVMPVSAATDEYFIYSKFDPPGIGDVTAVGGYVEYYGVPDWGDEIQYVYFLSGNIGYKVKVWVTDGDGDGKVEPRQHPNHYIPEYQGPIEPRHFQVVSSKDLTGYTSGSGGHTEEFYVDSSGIYLGAYPYGINKWDHDWKYLGKIANSAPTRTESMAYNAADNVWYAGGRTRTIYELRDSDNDGSFLDESWKAIFTYPSYGGDHNDGLEYVGGYLWISDMTSDVIGKWEYDAVTSTWKELKRFTYTEPASVEGMGFGPNDHFWCGSGWGTGSYLYELGNEITKGYPIADAGPDVNNHPPIIPIKFDASGSHHTDPSKQIILYEWDFESDGAWDYSGTDLIVEHAYPAYYNPDGSIDWDKTAKAYTATLRVTDNSDPPLQTSDTRIVHITAPPWKPVADPNGPYEGWIGTPVQLDGSKSYDPESTMFPPDHPWYETIATYEWDFDYDGITFNVDSSEVKPSWTWHSEGKYIIALRVTDSQPSGPGGTIGPLDVHVGITTVTIKKEEEWSFAIITDLHIGYCYTDYGTEGWRYDDGGQDYRLTERLHEIVNWINNNPKIHFVVVLGDMSDTAEYSELLKARDILNGLKVPYIPIIGNHDIWPYIQETNYPFWRDIRDWAIKEPADSALGEQFFEEVFWQQNNKNYEKVKTLFGASWRRQAEEVGTYMQNYAFIYKGIKFVALDFVDREPENQPQSGGAKLHRETADWLRENLRELKPTILLSHHPMIYSEIPRFGKDIGFNYGDAVWVRTIIEVWGDPNLVLKNFAGHTHRNVEDRCDITGISVVQTEAVARESCLVGVTRTGDNIRIVTMKRENMKDYNTFGNVHDENMKVPAWRAFRARSPVDLIVTDPEGITITKEIGKVAGMFYFEFDMDRNGDLDDIVIMEELKIGDYYITIVPEPDASPADTYTLEFVKFDVPVIVVIILAEEVQISNIPTKPYILRSTETEIISIIPATVDLDPDVLNLRSTGTWVTVYMELPVGHGYNVSMINLTSVVLNGQVPALTKPIGIGDYDGDGIPDLMVKFSRKAVQRILQVGDRVEITISGKLIDGRIFEGKDIIRVILPP